MPEETTETSTTNDPCPICGERDGAHELSRHGVKFDAADVAIPPMVVHDLPGPVANGDTLTITWDTAGNASAHRTIPGEVAESRKEIEP